ncbi:MAG: methionyl-tRNA formyltransferase [Wenzhouxiangellaceae bacterium]|nr:methionyl-tRNA formyltransferase [Wenzhouxiangellaceae bacterium]MBS3745650.1 methionyl-tRNA formyltransferase [Wenzhouxiangellaceae bacterium]MBS3822450.1 methionyl-tRNA formyltransferase [Wenzhouxiangellaceae bacterium]
MNPLRLVFAGTPEFACPSLAALIEHNRPVAVMTQPDRPSGRGRKLAASPVKRLAVDAGIEVLQPNTLKDERTFQALAALEPDLLVTAAYGLLLPKRVLGLPRLGCWNLHASLLPRWRGASPIQQAILAGDARTGITLMQMDTGLDTGDMLATAETAIGSDETAGELHDRLAEMAADVLIEALRRHSRGTLPDPTPQDDARATHAPLIRKSDAAVDWTLDADAIERRVRAYNPWPVAYAEVAGTPLRIFRARAHVAGARHCTPGMLITGAGHPDTIRVACGRGVLEILELQAPGRKRVSATQWLNANADWAG